MLPGSRLLSRLGAAAPGAVFAALLTSCGDPSGPAGSVGAEGGLTGGAGGAAGEGGSGQPPAFPARRLEAGPTYLGTVDNGADCGRRYATTGFEPDGAAGGRYPLFLYFTGTNFVLTEEAFRQEASLAALAVTEAMARRGFVALWVEYDNSPVAWASDHENQLRCLFDPAAPEGALSGACALPQVDCDRGVATWGHSLGALVAHKAHDLDPRVRAAWLTGYGGDAAARLPLDRLRVVNGEADSANGTVSVLNAITGFTAADCPDDGRSECLRPDGSGWVIVRRADCQVSSADHCWFDKRSCLDGTPVLEPAFAEPSSTRAFALEPNADWVAATARRP